MQPGNHQAKRTSLQQPKIGGAVSAHVDSTFLRTEPIERLVGLWLAVDEATEVNGCLWFIPGSHRRSVGTDYRFIRSSTDGASKSLVEFVGQKPAYSSEFIAVPVKKGES